MLCASFFCQLLCTALCFLVNVLDSKFEPFQPNAVVEQQPNGSQYLETRSGASYEDFNEYLCSYALPSAPGCPHILAYDDSSVTLSWTPPDRCGDCSSIDGYQVQYRKVSEPELWRSAFDTLVPLPECTVTNLEPGEQYVFCVIAKSATGFGQRSTFSPVVQLKGTPLPSDRRELHSGVPFPPEDLIVAEQDEMGITLCWAPPVHSGLGGSLISYEIQCRTSERMAWVPIGESTSPFYRVTGLRGQGFYEFRVLAKNAIGVSAPSCRLVYQHPAFCRGPLEGSTTPSPPVNLQVSDVDSSRCTVSWSPPPNQVPTSISYVVQFREIGDPQWRSATLDPMLGTELTVINLHPNSTYEFRVFSCGPNGNLSHQCLISDIVQLRPALLSSCGYVKTIPACPSAPSVTEIRGNCVTLTWDELEAVQGYQVEFCDLSLSPGVWNPLNQILTSVNRMNVGDLDPGHSYAFRVVAKNAIGYSKPSEASRPVIVRPVHSSMVSLPVEMREAKESPPITDNDESPPPLRRLTTQSQSGGIHYRDPTLPEVIDYLSSPDNSIKMNAAGYLQHLAYNDDDVKQRIRALGGIHKLVSLLSVDMPEVQRNAAGCLRNLCYGRDDNKRAIMQANGLVALANLLKSTPEVLIVEEVTGTLWNMSSCHDMKSPIFELCSDHLVRQIIIPHCNLSSVSTGHPVVQPPLIFRNATGIVLNISTANDASRKLLRDKDGLVQSLVTYLQSAFEKKDYDSKTVVNVVCLLRNLSYRLQELEDPRYDRSTLNLHERSKSAPSGSPKATWKKGLRKKRDLREVQTPYVERPELRNVAPLFKADTVRLYMALLQNSTNPDVLEASAGAVQNLCACYWQPSMDVRAFIRKEKGLPVFVELLRTDADKVKRAAATALRNLALDIRNRELIGTYAEHTFSMFLLKNGAALSINSIVRAAFHQTQFELLMLVLLRILLHDICQSRHMLFYLKGKYAMAELVALLPYARCTSFSSEDLVVAALSLIYATTSSSADFAKTMHDRGGIPRLIFLSKADHSYSSKVRVYAQQVLKAVWQHQDLQDVFRKSGFKDEEFLIGPARSPVQVNTLIRPLSTSGVDRYPSSASSRICGDDSTLRSQLDRMHLDFRGSTVSFDRTPPPYGGSAQYAMSDPLYAQIQKMGRAKPSSLNASYASSLHQPAGDSWV
ncbi:fibronectin type III domain protein [Trichuris suis]|nr:fibronectin type III domain protein [Trichuris suis]